MSTLIVAKTRNFIKLCYICHLYFQEIAEKADITIFTINKIILIYDT